MAISDNINDIAKAIHDEWQKFNNNLIPDTPIATDVRTKSAAAIRSGQGSTEWVEYMRIFSKGNSQVLDRLVPNPADPDPVRQDARAYLVANGMCSMGTTDQIANGVENKLNLP
jgi:hypothetical protein